MVNYNQGTWELRTSLMEYVPELIEEFENPPGLNLDGFSRRENNNV